MKGKIKKKMNRRLKPCCCSQEQMSCDLLWPCKISLGIWTDFNRLFIENFFGEKNLNEMFFFSRCSWESGASSERPWQLCCEHIHSQSDGEHIHTHTHLFSQLYSCLLFPWRQKLSCCQRLISWQAPSTAKTLASPTAEKCSRWCHAGCSHVHF